ncbi:MAG: thermonuclease family protein [Thiothrix sp.]|nr:thermonuclease family protein [Thiothrix sp.]HPE61429.1 thermonuclease family protein [Thiolinea sp.]
MLLVLPLLGSCRMPLDPSTDTPGKLPPGTRISSAGTLLARGQVVRVSDGDTLKVMGPDRKPYTIRLQGIDAPEGKQAYGQLCKEKLARKVLNLPVELEAYKQDRYGRIVAKVSRKGEDVALSQLQEGCGWHYKAYANEQSPSDRAAYALAETEAHKARRGLWRAARPQAPWDYRARYR